MVSNQPIKDNNQEIPHTANAQCKVCDTAGASDPKPKLSRLPGKKESAVSRR